MKREVVVRPAEYDDGGDIIKTMALAHQEVNLPTAPPIRPGSDWFIDAAISKGLVFVADHGKKKCIGVVILEISVPTWNPDTQYGFLRNVHFFVDPEYRMGGTAKALLKKSKRVAEDLGIPFLFTHNGGERIAAMERWVGREDFEPIGGNFLWLPYN